MLSRNIEGSGGISVVGYFTCNRPKIVERGLASYIKNDLLVERRSVYYVMDDSCDFEIGEANRSIAQLLADRYQVDIVYCGRSERRLFLERVLREAGLAREIAEFAVFGERLGLTTFGASRNAFLLMTGGRMLLNVDDDTICSVAPTPFSGTGCAHAGGEYPSEIQSFASRSEALEAVQFSECNLARIHENWLAASSRTSANTVDKIRVTVNGLVGDCGWGSPIAYLFVPGFWRRIPLNSRSTYEEAISRREVVQAPRGVRISDGQESLMMTVAGLDNRELLPPFLPIGRGQDAVFGTTLAVCFPGSAVAHLPYVVVHAPIEERRFHCGELYQSACGIDLATSVSALLKAAAEGLKGSPGVDSLRRTGARLVQSSNLSTGAFREFVDAAVGQEVRSWIGRLERQRADEPTGTCWSEDAQRFVALLRRSAEKTNFSVPLELLRGRTVAEGELRMRQVIGQFGNTLTAWPDLVDAARRLEN
jgi:hypothetical protein